ncbi:hypothetical protein LR392_14965 [Arthrobacter sp. AK04]|uniref:hypothetical protein n=1 Tax=Arthrobacter sp. AK04 TaxID=2900048 RepID=UPI001E5B790E|nr:hypothetical protein [Arthrobacter sp. AK04]MCD5343524.1 hypothetical protein [Arthrobacter sp. AK04]
MTTVAVPFVRTEASQNPNLSVRTGEDPAEPYMRAMTVAFASIRRWNPDAKLELISNVPPELVHLRNLERVGVEYKSVPFDHRPPSGFTQRFSASLYMLDALAASTAEMTVLIDPDVLCIDRLNKMLPLPHHAAALKMPFPPNEDINGLTRAQAGGLHAELGEPCDSPEHFGGEVYVVPQSQLGVLVERNEAAWALALRRRAADLPTFTTEEHILSYSLRGLPTQDLAGYVRRIWTTHRYRQVNGKESDLVLWHLPAEKDRGFRRLYPFALDRTSWFWQSERSEFVERSGKAMGFHSRVASRFAKDTMGAVVAKLQGMRLEA